MDTPLNAELRPSLGFPPSAAYMQIRLGDHSATSFPWAEKTGHRTECGGGGIEPKKNVVADWLKALERSFGTSARMISAQSESLETGDGSVCRALDGLCGRRPLCLKVHSCMRRAVVESGCLQQIRCPLGFLLLAVPVQRDENGCSLLEFGPLGVEHKTRAQFEQGLDRLGFSPALRTHLRAPLNALRTVRAEDIDGVLALLERVAASIADEMLQASSSARLLEPKAVAAARRFEPGSLFAAFPAKGRHILWRIHESLPGDESTAAARRFDAAGGRNFLCVRVRFSTAFQPSFPPGRRHFANRLPETKRAHASWGHRCRAAQFAECGLSVWQGVCVNRPHPCLLRIGFL